MAHAGQTIENPAALFADFRREIALPPRPGE